jgi:hypothetical protein
MRPRPFLRNCEFLWQGKAERVWYGMVWYGRESMVEEEEEEEEEEEVEEDEHFISSVFVFL